MFKAPWVAAAMGAIALGISIFGIVINNNNNVQAQSAKVSALSHRESIDRREIATLRAELHSLSAPR